MKHFSLKGVMEYTKKMSEFFTSVDLYVELIPRRGIKETNDSIRKNLPKLEDPDYDISPKTYFGTFRHPALESVKDAMDKGYTLVCVGIRPRTFCENWDCNLTAHNYDPNKWDICFTCELEDKHVPQEIACPKSKETRETCRKTGEVEVEVLSKKGLFVAKEK